ncbi:MAG: hypothetical protein ABW077_10980 [Candidatus Thiodiazotropha endolucinida]
MEHTFYSPKEMLERVEKELDEIPNCDLFNNPKYQKLTEEWCASMFAVGYEKFISPCKAVVNESKENTEADFFIKTEGSLIPFQLTEVQAKDRKRGKEYKENPDGFKSYMPAKANKNAHEWIFEGIEKKYKKRYAGAEDLNLVVYVNFEVSMLNYDELLNYLEEFKGKFRSIWLITNTHICSFFSQTEIGEICGWGEVRSISEYYV